MPDTKQNIELEQTVSNHNKNLIAAQEANIYIARSGLMATVFAFMSNIVGIGKFVPYLAQFLFPALFATEALEAAINAEALRKAKNKNMGKWWDFLFTSAKAALVGFVVFGIPAGILAATVGHFIFLGVMGSLFLYHASSAIYNIHKWRKTDDNTAEGKALKAQYLANFKKHLIITGIAAILTIIVAVVIAFAPFIIPIIPTIVAAAGAIVLTAGLLFGLYKLGSYLKGRWDKSKGPNDKTKEAISTVEKPLPMEALEENIAETRKLVESPKSSEIAAPTKESMPSPEVISNANNLTLDTTTPAKPKTDTAFFYQRAFRELKLVEINQKDAQADKLSEKVAFLFNEGLKKIAALEVQMKAETQSFFGGRLWNENSKRQQKIEMICMLLGTLGANTFDSETTFIACLKANEIGRNYLEKIKSGFSSAQARQKENPEKNAFDLLANDDVYKLREEKGAYQSFTKNVGDVQDFAEAVEAFFKPELSKLKFGI